MTVTQGFKAKANQQVALIRESTWKLRELAQQNEETAVFVGAEFDNLALLLGAESKRVLAQEDQLKALDHD